MKKDFYFRISIFLAIIIFPSFWLVSLSLLKKPQTFPLYSYELLDFCITKSRLNIKICGCNVAVSAL